MAFKQLDARFFDLAGAVDVGESERRTAGEFRSRLDGELVPGDVVRFQPNGLEEVVEGLRDGLVRQRVHQVEVQTVDTRCLAFPGGVPDVVRAVNSPEHSQACRIEGLRPEGDTRDSGAAIVREVTPFDGAGVRLEGDFPGIGQTLEQNSKGLGREEAGRAAAEVHGGDASITESFAFPFEIVEQRLAVFGLAQRFLQRVRVEVAVGALSHAPREVDVEAHCGRRRHG